MIAVNSFVFKLLKDVVVSNAIVPLICMLSYVRINVC